jgi:hypothetical protein
MLRICLPIIKGFVEWSSETGLTGHARLIFQMNLDTIVGNNKNWTILLTNSADECLDQLERNESDVTINTVYFPVNHPNVKEGPVAGEFNMAITSFYNSTISGMGKDVDIIDTFNSLNPEIWVLILGMLTLVGALMTIGYVVKTSFMMRPTKRKVLYLNRNCELHVKVIRNRKKYRKKLIIDDMKETFDVLWKGLINKDESLAHPFSRKNESWSRGILRISLCFFMFLIIFYFTSMVRTELVTVSKPKTINTYQDILDENMIPVFIGSSDDYHTFKQAKKGTMERRIWDRLLQECPVYQKCLKTGVGEFSQALQVMMEFKKVLIASMERSYVVRPLSCSLKELLGDINSKPNGEKRWTDVRSWVRKEPTTPARLRGNAFSKSFNAKNVSSRLQAVLEYKLEKHIYTITELMLLNAVIRDKYTADRRRLCMTDTIDLKSSAVVYPPSILNFRKLFTYQFCLGLCIAFSVFILETGVWIVKKGIQQKRAKKRRDNMWFSIRFDALKAIQ